MTVIEIQPSRLLVILVVALHAAAAFSFVMWASPMWVSSVCLAIVAVSLFYFVFFWRRCKRDRLGLLEEGALLVDPDGADERALALLPATVVFCSAVWLVWRDEARHENGVELIVRDQVTSSHWRALQIWARLRAKPAGVSRQESGI